MQEVTGTHTVLVFYSLLVFQPNVPSFALQWVSFESAWLAFPYVVVDDKKTDIAEQTNRKSNITSLRVFVIFNYLYADLMMMIFQLALLNESKPMAIPSPMLPVQ